VGGGGGGGGGPAHYELSPGGGGGGGGGPAHYELSLGGGGGGTSPASARTCPTTHAASPSRTKLAAPSLPPKYP